MTSILKSENTKNGIIHKEIVKKFEEATSTSGCDLEMYEITSSMPNSLLLNKTEDRADIVINAQTTAVADIVEDTTDYVKINDDETSEIEDVIDGFSIFSFVAEEDIIKFTIKTDKTDSLSESENSKCKNMINPKRKNKVNKTVKDMSFNEDGIDIYDFQGNSESSPSSKNSSSNSKKIINKKNSCKYNKIFKHKFKAENTLSPNGENSSSTSVTEFHNNLLGVDGHNESPRPTSNDDNNVVSTTTPDNVNIELEKLDLANNIDKMQSASLLNPLKTASLRLYKLKDELSLSNHSVTDSNIDENITQGTEDQKLSTFYTGSDMSKIYGHQNQITCHDEIEYQPKIVPTKFSVDLLTKIADKLPIIDDTNKCLINTTSWTISRKKSASDSNSSAETSSIENRTLAAYETGAVATGDSHRISSKMTSTALKQMIGGDSRSSASYMDGSISSNGSCNNARTIGNNDNPLTNDDEAGSDRNISTSSVNYPMQSWLELQKKGLLHQQHNFASHSNVQSNANSTIISPKSTSSNSFNPRRNSPHNPHLSNSIKSQQDSALLDWKNNYFDSTKLLANSVPKFSQNFNSLSQELANNIRYQQEQQELMNALRLKHENSKIPKPLVNMGIDQMYKVDHSLYKNPESKFQTPNIHNYFMPNSQLPAEFNTANVFKSRSDPRCHQSQLDATSNKDSFSKVMSTMSSSNFKTPETVKRRGQWCDMHVKIALFIYRSQRRISMAKSQEINPQLPQMMYSPKMPPAGPVPTASPYPASFLQHSSPYMDYRPSHMKQDPGYLPYQQKSSSSTAFLNAPLKSINPYHSLVAQSVDPDSYEDHQQSPEQKWLKLLSQYMTNHPLSTVDRPNPEILNQFYLWYQQLAQNNNNNNNVPHHYNAQTPPSVPMQSANLDLNSVYLRKYMENLSSYLGSMKPDSNGYGNNERDMQMYLLKQQQYQKALLSKYQSAAMPKPSGMHHMNPPLMNSANSFYSKKTANPESMMPQYADCVQSMVNQKYRHDQIRQMKQDSLANHHSRNGFSKMSDSSTPKRRKLNPESLKTEVAPIGNDKEEPKTINDLTTDYVNIATLNNNNLGKAPSKNLNFHIQTAVPDAKE